MFDQQDGDLELVPDLDDVCHQFFRLVGVHTGCRLVQKQQLRPGRQRPDDLQPPLGAVGQAARPDVRQSRHIKDVQQLQGLFMLLFFRFPVLRHPQDPAEHAVPDLVVQADPYVLLHRHVVEQADILEGSRDSGLVDVDGGHAAHIPAFQHHRTVGRLVYLGQQVENRGLSGAVGADQAGDFRLAHDDVEVVHGLQAAEFDPQVAAFQHRHGPQVPLRNDGSGGIGYHRGVLANLRFTHARIAPSPSAFSFRPGISRFHRLFITGLLLSSIARISSTAYASIR